MKSYLKIAFVCIGVALLLGGLIRLFYNGTLQFNYPSTDTFPIQGIDVSQHQHDIDWQQIQQQQIRFAFIKATEGGDFKDPKFNTNWEAAIQQGIDVGAYHFFTFCKSGREQAENFIHTVPKTHTALPPVIDLEFGGNCTLKKEDAVVLKEIDTLQSLLTKHYGREPILYVTKEFYTHFLIDRFPDHPIWIRDIYQEPTLSDHRSWTFWQYANRGHLEGIDTYVDLNVFYGTEEEYELFKVVNDTL